MNKIIFFLAIIPSLAYSQLSHDLSLDLKSFQGRIKAYQKCVQGKCSAIEQKQVAKAAIKDGFLIVGSVAFVGIGSIGLHSLKMKPLQVEAFKKELKNNGFSSDWLVDWGLITDYTEKEAINKLKPVYPQIEEFINNVAKKHKAIVLYKFFQTSTEREQAYSNIEAIKSALANKFAIGLGIIGDGIIIWISKK